MVDKIIPARYVGEHEIVLAQFGGPYRDGDGKPLESLILRKGDTLMMREAEVLGFTVKFDPRGEADAEMLGTGRVVKPEHTDLSDDELTIFHGYQFHQGREDFEPVEAEPVVEAPAELKA